MPSLPRPATTFCIPGICKNSLSCITNCRIPGSACACSPGWPSSSCGWPACACSPGCSADNFSSACSANSCVCSLPSCMPGPISCAHTEGAAEVEITHIATAIAMILFLIFIYALSISTHIFILEYSKGMDSWSFPSRPCLTAA